MARFWEVVGVAIPMIFAMAIAAWVVLACVGCSMVSKEREAKIRIDCDGCKVFYEKENIDIDDKLKVKGL